MMARGIVFLLLLMPAGIAIQAQEIPLESCRQLPIVKAAVGKHQFQFLLDTGATTTLLNLKSFSSTDATEITMESWNGTVAAKGRKITLSKLAVGEHELENLSLLAVDLTQLERSCQRRVDGVLGADLIARLGLTIDLKNHVGILEGQARSPEARLSELMQQQAACEQAFNRSDEKAFAECLAPDIVLLTSKGDYRGRNSVMKHFKESYFGQDPPVQVSLTPRTRRAIGPVIWMEYDMAVTFRGQVMKTRGTALYQKTGDRWLMSNMNYSVAEAEK
jgi:ketosteroid isomerase-like protein